VTRDERYIVIGEVLADVRAGLVIAHHRDERARDAEAPHPDRNIERGPADQLADPSGVVDLVDEGVADDDGVRCARHPLILAHIGRSGRNSCRFARLRAAACAT